MLVRCSCASAPIVNTGGQAGRLTPTLLDRITIDKAQCGGRPCLRGMRIRVVLELLSSGASFDEVLAHYPYLEHHDILAATQYAARQIDHPVLLSA